MADSRGSNPISQLWTAAVSPEPDSECLYEEISGLSGGHELDRSDDGSDGDRRRNGEERGRAVVEYTSRVEEQYVVRGSYGESGPGAALDAAATLKLTRGRTARYVSPHYQYGGHIQRSSGRSPRHHLNRGSFSNETQEEIQEDDEATLRELLVRYVRTLNDSFIEHVLRLSNVYNHRNDRWFSVYSTFYAIWWEPLDNRGLRNCNVLRIWTISSLSAIFLLKLLIHRRISLPCLAHYRKHSDKISVAWRWTILIYRVLRSLECNAGGNANNDSFLQLDQFHTNIGSLARKKWQRYQET